MQEQGALGVLHKKGLETQYHGLLMPKGVPKVTSYSGHQSFLTDICPSPDS